MHSSLDNPNLYTLNLLYLCRAEEIIEAEASLTFLKNQFTKSEFSSNPQPDILMLDRVCFSKGDSVVYFNYDPNSVKQIDKLQDMHIMLVDLKEEHSSDFYYPAVSYPYDDVHNCNLMMILLEFGFEQSKAHEYNEFADNMIVHMNFTYTKSSMAIADLVESNEKYLVGIVSTDQPDVLSLYQPFE